MINTATTGYKKSQITCSSPDETVLMLYDGAINFLMSAISEISEKRDITKKTRLIERAVSVIDYLQLCLDKEKGGEIAKNLDGLYEYMLIRLTEANLKNDKDKIDEVVRLLLTIREGWARICSNDKDNEDIPIDPTINPPKWTNRKMNIRVKI